MTHLLQGILAGSLGVGLVALVGMGLLPLLSRRYTAKTLYALCLVWLVAFVTPFSLAPNPFGAGLLAPGWLAVPAWGGGQDNGLGPVEERTAPLTGASSGGAGADASGAYAPQQGREGDSVQGGPEGAAPSLAAPAPEGQAALAVPSAGGLAGQGAAGLLEEEGAGSSVASQPGPTWGQLLVALWLLVALGLLVTQGVRHGLFLRTVRRWRKPLDGPLYGPLLAQALQAQGVRSTLPLYLCPSISSPMLIGVLRPALYLPDEALAPQELALVLEHEAVHYRRGDLWVKGTMALVTALCWLNPMAWLVARATAFYQEASCDEVVTQHRSPEDKRFYSETIIRVIRRQAYPRTALSTSFYGGKNGMKRRILSIMQEGPRRQGIALVLAFCLGTAATGLALTPSSPEPSPAPAVASHSGEEKVPSPWVGKTAYVSGEEGGTRLLSVPTANDWSVPLAAYANGVALTVLETRESSTLPQWDVPLHQDNWALVAIGGDGQQVGIQGWMPLHHLSLRKPTGSPLWAVTRALSPTGHINLYARNQESAPFLSILPEGQQVRLLGHLDTWLHLETEDGVGFALTDTVDIPPDTEKALAAFLPYRFDFISREAYDQMMMVERLVAEKAKSYGGQDLEAWTAEDLAWYRQLIEATGQVESNHYVLPGKDDLSQEEALAIAWAYYAQVAEVDPSLREEYQSHAYLYTAATGGQRLWSVRIQYGDEDPLALTVSSPEGELSVDPATLEEYLAYLREVKESRAYQDALRAWQEERGDISQWTHQERADFYQEHGKAFGDRHWAVPGEGSIQEDQALRVALAELKAQYGITEKEIAAWRSVAYYYQVSATKAQWQILLMNEENSCLGHVTLEADTGKVVDISNPLEPGNG